MLKVCSWVSSVRRINLENEKLFQTLAQCWEGYSQYNDLKCPGGKKETIFLTTSHPTADDDKHCDSCEKKKSKTSIHWHH